MDASQWKYFGEGGKHALFSFQPHDAPVAERTRKTWEGRLLRVRKYDLALASAFNAKFSVNDGHSLHTSIPRENVFRNDSVGDSLRYIREYVVPGLSEVYVNLPEVVILDWVFVRQLREHALEEGRIPSSRLKDWTWNGTLSSSHYHASVIATIQVDYRRIRLSEMRSCAYDLSPYCERIKNCLSVEIKPKAGYVAFSPLVDPLHRIKYEQTRFALLQRLQLHGHIQKGWRMACTDNTDTITTFQVSEYNPTDLFSNIKERIQTSIVNLFRCPQNNIRVWHNNSLIVGLGDEGRIIKSTDGCLLAMNATFSGCNSHACLRVQSSTDNPVDDLCSTVSDVVSTVLSYQDLLQRLLRLQRLDVLDTDGAILVYERLVSLYNGSHKDAEEAIDSYVSSSSSSSMPEAPTLLSASPFLTPWPSLREELSSTCNLKELCINIERFSQQLDSFRVSHSCSSRSTKTRLPDHDMELIREESIKLVESLSKDECVYLLQNWLLSLAMCDVSIFITIQQRHGEAKLKNMDADNEQAGSGIRTQQLSSPISTRPEVVGDSKLTSRTSIIEPVDALGEGILVWTDFQQGRSQQFDYNIKVIDCDCKPAKKLRSRRARELLFRNLSPNS